MKIRVSKAVESAVMEEVLKNTTKFERIFFNKATWKLAAKEILENGMRIDAAVSRAKRVAIRNTAIVASVIAAPSITRKVKEFKSNLEEKAETEPETVEA